MNPALRMAAHLYLWVPGAILLVMLPLAIHSVHDNWNVDATTYARIAHYYLNGQFNLALNGYFGPLLSWIAIPALWFTLDGYASTYFAMAVSAIVFVCGAMWFVRASGIANELIVPAGLIIVLFAVYWSVAVVTPDLLAAGFLLSGLAPLVDDPPKVTRFRLAAGGVAFGLAVLAKSVMLPIIFMAISVVLTMFIRANLLSFRQAISRIAILGTVMVLIIAPWCIVVSLHYGKPVLSTSAAINHALVGPPEVDRYHPMMRTYHQPDSGRLTSWEDPSQLSYKYWRVFESPENIKHQISVISSNAVSILRNLASLDGIGLGLMTVFCSSLATLFALFNSTMRNLFAENRWIISGPLALIAGLPYLPVFSDAQRYYMVSYPMMIVCSMGAIVFASQYLGVKMQLNSRALAALQTSLVALCLLIFALPFGFFGLMRVFVPPISPSFIAAKEISQAIAGRKAGALASSGNVDHETLMAAYLTGRQYFGGRRDNPNLREMLSSGATFLVTEPGSHSDDSLRQSGLATEIKLPHALEKSVITRVPFRLYEVESHK